jgi:hypothetical protein
MLYRPGSTGDCFATTAFAGGRLQPRMPLRPARPAEIWLGCLWPTAAATSTTTTTLNTTTTTTVHGTLQRRRGTQERATKLQIQACSTLSTAGACISTLAARTAPCSVATPWSSPPPHTVQGQGSCNNKSGQQHPAETTPLRHGRPPACLWRARHKSGPLSATPVFEPGWQGRVAAAVSMSAAKGRRPSEVPIAAAAASIWLALNAANQQACRRPRCCAMHRWHSTHYTLPQPWLHHAPGPPTLAPCLPCPQC